MSDELRRRLARAAGDGDIDAARSLLTLNERMSDHPRQSFAASETWAIKSPDGQFILETVAPERGFAMDKLHGVGHRETWLEAEANGFSVVRATLIECSHEETGRSLANYALRETTNAPKTCQALKKNGERCRMTRGLGVVSDHTTPWRMAILCPGHWKNIPHAVVVETDPAHIIYGKAPAGSSGESP